MLDRRTDVIQVFLDKLRIFGCFFLQKVENGGFQTTETEIQSLYGRLRKLKTRVALTRQLV
jgi:hypothetical protein